MNLNAVLDVDRIVHEPARLVLLAHLLAVRSADFVYLQRETGLTAGNISSHVAKLEAAGYLKVDKGFVGKRPQTTLKLTPSGRKAVRRYLATMATAMDAIG